MAVRSKPIILFPLFIGILCLSFPATTTSTSSSDVDFLYLTLTWPGTLCSLSKCCMPTTTEPALDFMIEDIKTYNNKTVNIVQNCNKTCQFSVNKMKDYMYELLTHWSDFSCPCNKGLENWKKTWCTYGQCSNLNQHDYIQTALDIFDRVNLLEVLEVNRIVPSSSAKYKLQDIQNALRVNYGFSTLIECAGPWWYILPTKPMLSKISFCVSKDGKCIVDCPFNTKKTTCGDEVWFYPITGDVLRPLSSNDSADQLIKMPIEEYFAV